MISRLSTICLSMVSPSPLTAVAPHQSPDGSSPYGSRELGGTNRYYRLDVYKPKFRQQMNIKASPLS